MRLSFVFAICVSVSASLTAQEHAIRSQPKLDASAAHFDATLNKALSALKQAGSFALDVESTWTTAGQSQGHAGSHTRLLSSGGRYRVEVQSTSATVPDLICANEGKSVTTYYPARKL